MEVSDIHDPDTNAQIMAERLAYSLDRGRHYKRAAYYILRRVIDSGDAMRVELRITGKINSQRERTYIFKAERKSKSVQSSNHILDIGTAQNIQEFGKLRILVKIIHVDSKINGLNKNDLLDKFQEKGEAELEKAPVEYIIKETEEEPSAEDKDPNC